MCSLIIISIISPINYAVTILKTVANVDFTKPVDDKYKTSDEIGMMMCSADKMIATLRTIIQRVISESNNVDSSITGSKKLIADLILEIEDVSTTTEELAGGMEETAASTQEMNATSLEIGNVAKCMALKAQEASVKADEISDRANDLKDNAVKSQKQAYNIYKQTQVSLVNSIEESKAVDQINDLATSILSITSQTNLLALNTAIEAARAGDAGKGFAVVADEIRKLANESSETVSQIQSVTKTVIVAVENLSVNSRKVLDFIDIQVIKDYEVLVKTGDLYSNDADYVNQLVTDFSATSEELLASIQSMVGTINEVTMATNEGASGTTNIAQKTTMLVNKSDEVVKHSNSAKASSGKLYQMISTFKV